MINLKISDSGNFEVSNGSLVRVTGDDAIIQNLRVTIYHLINEWFLNINSGIDYRGQVLTKVYDPTKATRVIKRAIQNAEGINSIQAFELTRSGKEITVSFSARTINATIIRLDESLQI
jgi:hypothetical protein